MGWLITPSRIKAKTKRWKEEILRASSCVVGETKAFAQAE